MSRSTFAALGICVAPLLAATAQVQPINDDFGNALPVTEPLPYIDDTDTSGATTAVDDPQCFGNAASVWYVYAPSTDGWVRANAYGSIDTTLSVYTGTRGHLKQIQCNDDTFHNVDSHVFWEAHAGEIYYLMVGAFYRETGGRVILEVHSIPPPVYTDLRVNAATVNPRNGEASINWSVFFSEPALVYTTRQKLLQRSGRGWIMGEQLKDFDPPDNVTTQFRDLLGGEGFGGGKAMFCVEIEYARPTEQVVERCQEVRLKGSP